MEQGRDVLVVYDDLTHHARAYRELSLLLRRPPGREAFPGDIFPYIHARLLESCDALAQRTWWWLPTALPIIETEAQNISAYIPTNLISITDGQIYARRHCSNWACYPPSTSANRCRALAARRNAPPTALWRATSNSPTRSSRKLETFARFGALPERKHPQDHRARTAYSRLPQTGGMRAGVRGRANRRLAGLNHGTLRRRGTRPDAGRGARGPRKRKEHYGQGLDADSCDNAEIQAKAKENNRRLENLLPREAYTLIQKEGTLEE